MGRPGVPERLLHRDLPARLPLRRPGARDRLPAQRRLPPPRGPRRRARPPCARRLGHRARQAGHPLRPHLARQPLRQVGPLPVRDEARPRAHVPPVQETTRAAHPGPPARRGQRRHLDVRRLRPQRLALPGHQRPLPRRRRPRHRLLLGDVRLRQHRPADDLLHPRPRGLPRRPARLLLRLRGRGARAAAHPHDRGHRRPRRPRHGRRRPRRTVRGVPRAKFAVPRGRPRVRPVRRPVPLGRLADAQQVLLAPQLPQPLTLAGLPPRSRRGGLRRHPRRHRAARRSPGSCAPSSSRTRRSTRSGSPGGCCAVDGPDRDRDRRLLRLHPRRGAGRPRGARGLHRRRGGTPCPSTCGAPTTCSCAPRASTRSSTRGPRDVEDLRADFHRRADELLPLISTAHGPPGTAALRARGRLLGRRRAHGAGRPRRGAAGRRVALVRHLRHLPRASSARAASSPTTTTSTSG